MDQGTPALREAIEARYTELVQTRGSLSCGTAVQRCAAEEGQVCVDLGCGRGKDVLALAARVGPAGHVYGVDLTAAMLEVAREAAAKQGVGHVSFVQAPLEALALHDGLADWVLSNCALNHARDKAVAWREIARVLKPGGRFVVSDIFAVEPIAPEYRDDPVAVAECWAGAETKEQYLAHVAEAGLAEVTVAEESAPYVRGAARIARFTILGRRPIPPSVAFEGSRTTHAKR